MMCGSSVILDIDGPRIHTGTVTLFEQLQCLMLFHSSKCAGIYVKEIDVRLFQ
jgi:hypothetical protein